MTFIQDIKIKYDRWKARQLLDIAIPPKTPVNTINQKHTKDAVKYLNFMYSRSYGQLTRWANGGEWFSNDAYPERFLWEMDTIRWLLKDVEFMISSFERLEKKK